VAARIEDIWAGGVDLFGAAFADRHHRGGSVAEQCPCDEGGHARIVLARERADFDRNQDRDVVGCATQVVVHSSHPRCPGHTAQTEKRNPPHIRAQPQPAGDAGIQRRHGDAGDGR